MGVPVSTVYICRVVWEYKSENLNSNYEMGNFNSNPKVTLMYNARSMAYALD